MIERRSTETTVTAWNIADVDAALGPGTYSLDTTAIGNTATKYYAPDQTALGEDREFCRDHFKPIDLHWDGGDGLMTFHLDPPLLFVGYRTGTTRSGVLTLRNAIYETIQASEATDPAGNVYRFRGRFNAICWGGALEIGPVAFSSQIVRSQDPIDRPALVRRGNAGGCGGGTAFQLVTYDPYEEPTDHECGGMGETGGGTGGVCGGSTSVVYDYICLDVWDGTQWVEWWCGVAAICN